MRSHVAVALLVLATVGPAISVPTRVSPALSPDAPSTTSTVATSGNDSVDGSAAMQLGMSEPLPVLSVDGDQTFRRRGEPAELVGLLARALNIGGIGKIFRKKKPLESGDKASTNPGEASTDPGEASANLHPSTDDGSDSESSPGEISLREARHRVSKNLEFEQAKLRAELHAQSWEGFYYPPSTIYASGAHQGYRSGEHPGGTNPSRIYASGAHQGYRSGEHPGGTNPYPLLLHTTGYPAARVGAVSYHPSESSSYPYHQR